jgi:hypothetical protein
MFFWPEYSFFLTYVFRRTFFLKIISLHEHECKRDTRIIRHLPNHSLSLLTDAKKNDEFFE